MLKAIKFQDDCTYTAKGKEKAQGLKDWKRNFNWSKGKYLIGAATKGKYNKRDGMLKGKRTKWLKGTRKIKGKRRN